MADYFDPFATDEPVAESVQTDTSAAATAKPIDEACQDAVAKAITAFMLEQAPWDKSPDPTPDLSWYKPSADLKTWTASELKIETGEGITYATLNRPSEDNKINDALLTALVECCMLLQYRKDMRVVVLSGAGSVFCAGSEQIGDQSGAFRSVDRNPDIKANVNAMMARAKMGGAFPGGDAKTGIMLKMKFYHTWSVLPQFTFCLVNGSAIDDGVGLACMCDMVISVKSAFFSLTEVKNGHCHALIAPYLVSKMGFATAKRLVLSSSLMGAEKAKLSGVVNELVETVDEAHTMIKELCEVVTACGPRSVEAAKQLVMGVGGKPITEFIMFYTGKMLAMVTVSDESRDGMKCLQARKPKPWEETPIKPLYG